MEPGGEEAEVPPPAVNEGGEEPREEEEVAGALERQEEDSAGRGALDPEGDDEGEEGILEPELLDDHEEEGGEVEPEAAALATEDQDAENEPGSDVGLAVDDGEPEDDDDGEREEELGGSPAVEPTKDAELESKVEASAAPEEAPKAAAWEAGERGDSKVEGREDQPTPSFPGDEGERSRDKRKPSSEPAEGSSNLKADPAPVTARTADDYAYKSSAPARVQQRVESKPKETRVRKSLVSGKSRAPAATSQEPSKNPRVRVLNQNERQLSRAEKPASYDQRETAVERRGSESGGSRVERRSVPSRVNPAPGAQIQRGMDNLVAELGSKLARQTAKLEAAEKGKEELEDMLLRIEKHFKTEQMLRRKAEVSLDQMRQSLKNSEMDGSRLKSERQALERQKLKNIQERTKLEEERSQMQVLIQTAGEQERKAKIELQELHHSVSTREEMIQYRLQASYSATIAKLESEIARLKEELEYRTVSMHQELQKWRDQAQFATNALREAKNEVIDRKRELDTTKERMDLLVEKLYTGRERGMELRGAIDVQIHQSQLAHEMREKFQAQQLQSHVPIEMPPPAYGGGAYPPPNEVSLRLPAVDAMPQRMPQPNPSESKPAVNYHRPKPEMKVDPGTPRIAQERGRGKAQASPSHSKVQASRVESRRVPRQKNVGYAQMHIRDRDSKESVKRPRGGQRTPPPSQQPSSHRGGKDRWTESKREGAMAAYAARWE